MLGKIGLIILMAFMLAGCAKETQMETVMDTPVSIEPAEKKQIVFDMPGEAAKPVTVSADEGTVYFCQDYTLTVYTAPRGDLQKTIQQATGLTPDALSVLETARADTACYNAVWSSAGETGDQVGRCLIMDDGHYHYVITAMADAAKAGQLSSGQWRQIFSSARLLYPDEIVSSGS